MEAIVPEILGWDLELARHVLVDPQVRLVEEEEIDVLDLHARRVQAFAQHFGHARHRVLEDELALHLREVAALVENFLAHARGSDGGAGRFDPELLCELALRVQADLEQRRGVVRLPQQQRQGRGAENLPGSRRTA